MTAEQFADAIGSITGEWDVHPRRQPTPAASRGGPAPSMPATSGAYGREWRAASSTLTRALGRPIRDQVISFRGAESTTPQALELVNGAILTRWLERASKRMLGKLPPEPLSLYNRTVEGRNASESAFDVDVSQAKRLWLIVQENGSNVPEVIQPVWAGAELVGPSGATPLSSLEPQDPSGIRAGSDPIAIAGTNGSGVRVKNPSVLVYDIEGKGYTRFRGVIGIENRTSDIGSTLNPQIRFYVFDAAPDMDRLLPPSSETPMPSPPTLTSVRAVVDRLFVHALGREPSAEERDIAEAALRNPSRGDEPSADGLADLLWALVMKPEFQLIY